MESKSGEVKTPEENPKPIKLPDSKAKTLQERMKAHIADNEGDITIVLEDAEIKVISFHLKHIDYFKPYLNGPWKETEEKKIILKQYCKEAFLAVLTYLYTLENIDIDKLAAKDSDFCKVFLQTISICAIIGEEELENRLKALFIKALKEYTTEYLLALHDETESFDNELIGKEKIEFYCNVIKQHIYNRGIGEIIHSTFNEGNDFMIKDIASYDAEIINFGVLLINHLPFFVPLIRSHAEKFNKLVEKYPIIQKYVEKKEVTYNKDPVTVYVWKKMINKFLDRPPILNVNEPNIRIFINTIRADDEISFWVLTK